MKFRVPKSPFSKSLRLSCFFYEPKGLGFRVWGLRFRKEPKTRQNPKPLLPSRSFRRRPPPQQARRLSWHWPPYPQTLINPINPRPQTLPQKNPKLQNPGTDTPKLRKPKLASSMATMAMRSAQRFRTAAKLGEVASLGFCQSRQGL